MGKYIVICRGAEVIRIPASRLVYIEAAGNYSKAYTQDNRYEMLSIQLGQAEELLTRQLKDSDYNFVRLGRSLIVNLDFLFKIDITSQKIVLSDCKDLYCELSASREVLSKLKAYYSSGENGDE